MKTFTETDLKTTSKAVANNIMLVKPVPLKTPALQTQLKIGKPNDEFEQEADRVAEQVMSMPESSVQQQPIEEEEEELMPKLQMQPIEEEEELLQPKPMMQLQPIEEEEEELMPKLQMQPLEEEEEMLQGKPMLQLQPLEEEEELLQPKWIQKEGCSSCGEKEMPELQTSTQALQMSPLSHIDSCGGQALPDSSRGFFESRMGYDFGSVRVHTSDSAVQMNQQLGAQAFTYGSNIFFNKGKYNSESSEGRRLLGHELTHVVQQNGNIIRKNDNDLPSWTPDYERYDADYRAADRHMELYVDSAQSTISAMLTAYHKAEIMVERIMSLEDPKSIWETVAVFALNVAIAAIPGAGPIASRLQKIERSNGGFFAKALEEGLKTIATNLANYAVTVDDDPPSIDADPGPLGQIERLNTAVQEDIGKRFHISEKWEEAWNTAKNDPEHYPGWNYNLDSIVSRSFLPIISMTTRDFQLPFEIILAKEAIRQTVQANSGVLLFYPDTIVYDFYRPSLSRNSLRELVNRYGWTVSQIVQWAIYWPGGALPWNWYRIEEGEEV